MLLLSKSVSVLGKIFQQENFFDGMLSPFILDCQHYMRVSRHQQSGRLDCQHAISSGAKLRKM